MPTDLARLKAQHDLEAVAASLTRQPIEAHKIACPFHADSTPSLHLYDNGKWHCFGCGKHGDVLDFIGYWLKRDAYRPEDHLLEVIDYLGGLAIRPLLPTEKRIQPNAPAPAVTFPVEQLDRLHGLARQAHIVTPYSSMLVLVNEQQEKALAAAEQQTNRFERDVERGDEVLQKPNNPFSASMTPEPEEWLLLVVSLLVAGTMVWRRRTATMASLAALLGRAHV